MYKIKVLRNVIKKYQVDKKLYESLSKFNKYGKDFYNRKHNNSYSNTICECYKMDANNKWVKFEPTWDENENTEGLLDWYEAVKKMYEGKVVQYIPVIGQGAKFCMQRGVIFTYTTPIKYETAGSMVYDPKFRYKVVEGLQIDTKEWPNIV